MFGISYHISPLYFMRSAGLPLFQVDRENPRMIRHTITIRWFKPHEFCGLKPHFCG